MARDRVLPELRAKRLRDALGENFDQRAMRDTVDQMATSLLVSACWTSSEAAVGTLPLLLIPQITFSSIMVSVRDMEPLAKLASWFTVQRYTFDAVIKCGRELAVRSYSGDWVAEPINGSLWKLGLKFSDKADDQGFTIEQLVLIHVAYTLAMLALAVLVVWRRDSRR